MHKPLRHKTKSTNSTASPQKRTFKSKRTTTLSKTKQKKSSKITSKKTLTTTSARNFSNFPIDESITSQIPSISTSVPTTTTPRVAIIGSGPAAMYTAKYILQSAPKVKVHMIDQLHTPYGLVRNGIAPDHPEAKNVIADFQTNVLGNERTTFIGGVKIKELSTDSTDSSNSTTKSHSNHNELSISLADIYKHYHGVVIATGASKGKRLGIPNDTLNGVFDSHDFVSWYNGHPDYSQLSPPLNKAKNAIIIGNGNVSLDLARILISPDGYLNNSDIPVNVRDVLKKSNISNVYVCARRGILDAAYTIAELREILTLTTNKWNVDGENKDENKQDGEKKQNGGSYGLELFNIELSEKDKQIMTSNRAINRKTNLLLEHTKHATRIIDIGDNENDQNNENNNSNENNIQKNIKKKQLSFVYQANPSAVIASNDPNSEIVNGVEFTYMQKDNETGQFKPTKTNFILPPRKTGDQGDLESNSADTIVITSIGYQTVGLEGVPFDSKRNIYPTDKGRILIDQNQQKAKENNNIKTFSRQIFDSKQQKNETTPTEQIQDPLFLNTYPAILQVSADNYPHLNTAGYNIVPFVYASGWARRGPIGILGTNIGDAKETATSVVQDLTSWANMNHQGNSRNNDQSGQNGQNNEKSTELIQNGQFNELPGLELPQKLWSKFNLFATSQSEWGSIQLHEQSQAHCLGVESWIQAEAGAKGDKGTTGNIQSVFEGDFIVASVKENDWNVLRKAARCEM